MTSAAAPALDAPTISVLFVDDDPHVRAGLKRMLRSMRGAWTMRFVGSGREALALLHSTPADVVVSDMRMPGMDGSELMAEVARQFPGTVRIILSGQCDPETIAWTAGPPDLFLSKPCDTDELIGTITRTWRLRADPATPPNPQPE